MINKIVVVTGGAGFVGANLIAKLLKKTKYKIISIDNYSSGSTKNHIKDIRVKYIKDSTSNISKTLKLELNQVSVKSTTNDGLGFIGERKGISVITTSLVIRK